MSKKPDGGQAFPRQTFEYYPSLNKTHAGPCDPGMSLRDWFAGQALQGLLGIVGREVTWAQDAHEAYGLADAMLAEREKGGSA